MASAFVCSSSFAITFLDVNINIIGSAIENSGGGKLSELESKMKNELKLKRKGHYASQKTKDLKKPIMQSVFLSLLISFSSNFI